MSLSLIPRLLSQDTICGKGLGKFGAKTRNDTRVSMLSFVKKITDEGVLYVRSSMPVILTDFTSFFRFFDKRFYKPFFDIHPKNMHQLTQRSTFDERTKYIAAVHTGNA